MTIKELYQWAKENNVENYDIRIYDYVYGWYYPLDIRGLSINNEGKEVIL